MRGALPRGLWLVGAAALLCAPASAQVPHAASLRVSVEAPASATAGEVFEVIIRAEVDVRAATGGRLPVPEIDEPDWTALGLTVVSRQMGFRTEARPEGSVSLAEFSIRLVASQPGTINLPAISAGAALADGTRLSGQSQEQEIIVRPKGQGAADSSLPQSRRLALPVLVALILVPPAILVFVLWLVARRASRRWVEGALGTLPKPQDADGLAELREAVARQDAAGFYARAVPQIRQVLAHRFQFSETGLTTSEFMTELRACCPDRGLTERVEQCLITADGVKFAAGKPQHKDVLNDLSLVETVLGHSDPSRKR